MHAISIKKPFLTSPPSRVTSPEPILSRCIDIPYSGHFWAWMLVCARLAHRAQRTCRADRATDSGQSILPMGLSLDNDDDNDGLTLLPEGYALSPALDCFPWIQSRVVLTWFGSCRLLSKVPSDCFTSGQTPPMTVIHKHETSGGRGLPQARCDLDWRGKSMAC